MVNRVIECMSAMLDWHNKSLKGGITEAFYNNASIMVGVAMTREVEIETVVILVETLNPGGVSNFRFQRNHSGIQQLQGNARNENFPGQRGSQGGATPVFQNNGRLSAVNARETTQVSDMVTGTFYINLKSRCNPWDGLVG